MAEALEWLTEACTAGIEYLKKIRIAEIRQTLELVGVSHVQVVLALLVFAMLQFSKFTVVLLIACLIAYIIFYMVSALPVHDVFHKIETAQTV